MRFRSILQELNQYKGYLNIQRMTQVQTNIITISNYSSLMNTLVGLYRYPFLKKYFIPIEKQLFFNTTFGDNVNLSIDKFHILEGVVKELNNAIDVIIVFLNSNLEKQDQNTVSFKLFELTTFEEFYKFNDDMMKIILRPLSECGISIDMGELEEGSRWQSIKFKTVCGVFLFLSIARASYDFIIHDIQKERVVNEIINTYKEMGKTLDDFNQIIEKQQNDKLQEAANMVVSEMSEYECTEEEKSQYDSIIAILKKAEVKNDLQFSIKCMGEYIDKGLEIYQALDVPEEKRFEIPNYQQLIEQKNQKLLEESDGKQ